MPALANIDPTVKSSNLHYFPTEDIQKTAMFDILISYIPRCTGKYYSSETEFEYVISWKNY